MFIQLVSSGNRIQNPDSLGPAACMLSCRAKLYQPFKPYSFIDVCSKCAIPHPKRESSIDLSKAEATYADQRGWQLTRGKDSSMKKGLFFVQSSLENFFAYDPSMNGLPWWLRLWRIFLQWGDLGSIPGLGRFPGEGNGNPLQYFCLMNTMD